MKIESKRGQMTIWIIIAMVLVLAIVLFFLLRGEITPKIGEKIEENPKNYIASCLKKNVEDAVDIMLPQGGFISPEHTKLYNNIKVAYLCYNSGNYYPCVNEHPMLLNEIRNEIKNYIELRIGQCFQDYKQEMIARNIDIGMGNMELAVELGPERIFVEINRKITIGQKENSYAVNNFDAEIINPAYDLARVAMEIASQEAEFCYFEYGGYMILYPKFKIGIDTESDSTKIYTIEDKKSGKEMNIAIRSCAIPPGL